MTDEEKKQLTRDRCKGVREALKRERDYVSEGKGTRDWTSDQQNEILSGLQPHEENGKAYEGHHMKSVNGHTVQASNPNDIQWLTRDEHFEAHKGTFHNSTNGYYNPETNQTELFRRFPKAPEAKPLSNPVESINDQSECNNEAEIKIVTISKSR